MVMLDDLFILPWILVSVGAAILSGVVKGVVGFAMPMVLISCLSFFLSPEVALAGMILPTLVTNVMQALRHGPKEARKSMIRFRYFLMSGAIMLVIMAQFVAVLPAKTLLLLIGVPVTGFAALQLAGRSLPLPTRQSRRSDMTMGAFTGAVGGISAIWGPPTVAYLTAIGTPQNDQMRIQGIIYGLGAALLVIAHLGSGILNATTIPFSALLIPPAVLGMWIGGKIQDRFDQVMFRRATLLVLFIAGLNLLRRALF
jgi:uncharacterized membrane protein YfcA